VTDHDASLRGLPERLEDRIEHGLETVRDVIKPRLRGWLHAGTFPLSVVAGIVLVALSPDARARIATAVFAATAALLFGVSALYHRRDWGPRGFAVLQRLGAPRWLYVPVYVALGWVAILYTPQLLDGAGTAVFVLIVVGGALYTLGGLVYGIKRPNPSRRWFGFHEVFHALTVAAFAVHYTGVSIASYTSAA
jgi:hemolysin III